MGPHGMGLALWVVLCECVMTCLLHAEFVACIPGKRRAATVGAIWWHIASVVNYRTGAHVAIKCAAGSTDASSMSPMFLLPNPVLHYTTDTSIAVARPQYHASYKGRTKCTWYGL